MSNPSNHRNTSVVAAVILISVMLVCGTLLVSFNPILLGGSGGSSGGAGYSVGLTGVQGPQGIQGIGTMGSSGLNFNSTSPYTYLFNGTSGGTFNSTVPYVNLFNGTNGAVGINGVNAAITQPYSYLIYVNGSNYMAQNGTDGSIVISWTSTNGLTILQNIVNVLEVNPQVGGVIYIQSPFSAAGELLISHSNIGIVTNKMQDSGDYNAGSGVFIQNIKIDSTIDNVYLVKMQGFLTRQITFNVPNTSFSIGNSAFDDLVVAPKVGSGNGLIFNKTVNGSIDQVHFNRAVFQVAYGQDSGYGVVTWLNAGCGGLFFTDCNLESTYNGAKTFMLLTNLVASSGGFGDVQVSNLHIFNAANNLTLVTVKNQTSLTGWSGDVYGLNFVGGYWENHANLTLINIESSNRPEHHNTIFNGVSFFNGGNLTLVNNLNTNWQTDWKSSINFEGCQALGVISSIQAGPWNIGANFNVFTDITNWYQPLGALTVTGWTVAPTTLTNIYDGDWSTSATTGYGDVSAYNTAGLVTIDLGHTFKGNILYKVGVYRNVSSTDITIYQTFSTTGSSYYGGIPVTISGAASEIVYYGSYFVDARYIQLNFAPSQTCRCSVNIYEIQLQPIK